MNSPTINSTTSLIHVPNPVVSITAGTVTLDGELNVPPGAPGVVLFAHGCGSSRQSPRDRFIAGILRDAGFGTLLFDHLTDEEEQEDGVTGALCFDVGLLAKRLLGATRWLENQRETRGLKIGYFGADTGGGAALLAAAEIGDRVASAVCRGARPDLAGDVLSYVQCPTSLIVGGLDDVAVRLNEEAHGNLACEKELRIIPGASYLFEEPGKLEQVARISARWFARWMSNSCSGRKSA